MGGIVALTYGDAREEVLEGLVRQQVAIGESLFSKIRQQVVARRIRLETRAVFYLNQIEHRHAS